MTSLKRDALDFVRENDVKFVRLSFVDFEGVQKNLSVMSDALEGVFENGMVFDGAAAGIVTGKNKDFRLFPDVTTLHILPWRPQHGRVARFLCSIKDENGNVVPFDTRNILIEAVEKLKSHGLTCNVGTDCEFYLFKTDDAGNPTKSPQDNAGYFDIAPLDKGENVRREICLCLEEMGIKPMSSHHENGPGQNEINFSERDALSACDNHIIFKSVVKAIASRNGLFASFMPKPFKDKSGNGLAINFELFEGATPLFDEKKLSKVASGFIAGILNRAKELSLFFNSIPNSYERLGEFFAPDTVEFSENDRGKFARFAYKGKTRRLEIRSADSACNIYLVIALIILAGIEGVENGEKYEDFQSAAMPCSIGEAIHLAQESEFVKRALGAEFVESYTEGKLDTLRAYEKDSSAENQKAFERI